MLRHYAEGLLFRSSTSWNAILLSVNSSDFFFWSDMLRGIYTLNKLEGVTFFPSIYISSYLSGAVTTSPTWSSGKTTFSSFGKTTSGKTTSGKTTSPTSGKTTSQTSGKTTSQLWKYRKTSLTYGKTTSPTWTSEKTTSQTSGKTTSPTWTSG